jgi:hypothetical protein
VHCSSTTSRFEYAPIVSAAQQEALTQHVPTPIIVDLDWPRLGFIEVGLGPLVDQLDFESLRAY